jgi:hypothetical protein
MQFAVNELDDGRQENMNTAKECIMIKGKKRMKPNNKFGPGQ